VDAALNPMEARFALEPAVWIMVAIADKPRHGYAIMKEIRAMGGFSMRPGTLYAALARMERAGLVEEIQTANYRQRPFRLSAVGRSRLADDLRILADLAALGLRRLMARKSEKGVKR
jgi:DNA-binding PadR family transcriptional regulator